MEWLDRMNDALGYLEANLAGTADMEHAARLACCSVYHFGRMFSYIAGVPLSEYLRRRRMTLAAFDLQNGGRVLDVALRYGYESPTAFNRAFQSVHGVSPSAAQRDGAPLKAYPRISFKITVKGEAEMDYRIIKQEAFRIVGVREPLLPDFEDSFRRVPEFWGEAAASGTIPRLCLLMDAAPKGILGVSTCMPDAENYYYIAVASTRPAPEGMHEYVVPACTWAVFPGRGSMPAAMQELQKSQETINALQKELKSAQEAAETFQDANETSRNQASQLEHTLERTQEAMDWFWQLNEAYVREDEARCREILETMNGRQESPMSEYLPEGSAAAARFQEIQEALDQGAS